MSGPLETMAIFDAFGAGFEYTPPEFVKKNLRRKKLVYLQHPKWKEISPGYYTDDTQMAIALAELLLGSKPCSEWTHFDLASAFVEAFHRDPRAGYAGGFYEVLRSICSGKTSAAIRGTQFLRTVRPHSNKNGGAMRAGVLGLLPKTTEAIDQAMFQASLTHATVVGMGSAAGSALMTHYFHYDLGSKEDLPEFLEDMLLGWEHGKPWKGRVLAPGWQAVRAALTAILEGGTLTDVLRLCVGFGGDTDTVAAIAGCAASGCGEIDQDLPEGLVEGLEDGPFGRGFLVSLDQDLLRKFPGGQEEEPADQDDLIGELAADWDS